MTVNAPAKINLILDITGKLENGYHSIKTVMQTLELCDTITVSRANTGITISCNNPNIPLNEKNIAFKAAEKMMELYKIPGGVKININKKIPVAAGLAGGSTDCAAVLCAMNEVFSLGIDDITLKQIGTELGADVPFCIQKGTALCEGIGEILTPLKPYPEKTVLLVKPDFGVSTQWVYKNLDLNIITHPYTDAFIDEYSNNIQNSYKYMGNVLEQVTASEYAEIDIIKNKMLELGAEFSMMSGSGPTVFGLFKSEAAAKPCFEYFKNMYNDVILTKTKN